MHECLATGHQAGCQGSFPPYRDSRRSTGSSYDDLEAGPRSFSGSQASAPTAASPTSVERCRASGTASSPRATPSTPWACACRTSGTRPWLSARRLRTRAWSSRPSSRRAASRTSLSRSRPDAGVALAEVVVKDPRQAAGVLAALPDVPGTVWLVEAGVSVALEVERLDGSIFVPDEHAWRLSRIPEVTALGRLRRGDVLRTPRLLPRRQRRLQGREDRPESRSRRYEDTWESLHSATSRPSTAPYQIASRWSD